MSDDPLAYQHPAYLRPFIEQRKGVLTTQGLPIPVLFPILMGDYPPGVPWSELTAGQDVSVVHGPNSNQPDGFLENGFVGATLETVRTRSGVWHRDAFAHVYPGATP